MALPVVTPRLTSSCLSFPLHQLQQTTLALILSPGDILTVIDKVFGTLITSQKKKIFFNVLNLGITASRQESMNMELNVLSNQLINPWYRV